MQEETETNAILAETRESALSAGDERLCRLAPTPGSAMLEQPNLEVKTVLVNACGSMATLPSIDKCSLQSCSPSPNLCMPEGSGTSR